MIDESYRRYSRAGLVYEEWGDELALYQPDGSFYVDDIRYAWPHVCGLYAIHTMCSLIDDGAARFDTAGQANICWYSRPPTEEELDRWVATGSFNPAP